jgi:hypothetical protein
MRDARGKMTPMLRAGVIVSVLVALAAVGISYALLRSENSMAGMGVVVIGFFALLALIAIWAVVGGMQIGQNARSAWAALRQQPPSDDGDLG